MKMILLMLMLSLCGACQELPSAWRTRANRDIERYRKRDVALQLTDGAGRPLAGQAVQVRETRMGFPLGAAISGGFLNNPRWQAEFRKHFNTAVFENESKWTSNERVQGREDYRTADALVAWCQANRIAVRGHCVFYEGKGGQPDWLGALAPGELRAALDRRAVAATTHFRGKFISWDVNNEMLHGSFFIDRLGADIRPWMFHRVRALDPEARLFTNDFNVLSVDQNIREVETDAYVAHVRDLLVRGAPIDGVGIQGHVWSEDLLQRPDIARKRLAKVAALGLPIWISEFDYANPDAKTRADMLEMVYRTAFAQPRVEGIMMWVFWEGNSWRRPTPAGLFNEDWSINEEGRRFEALQAEWTTTLTVLTDSAGRADFRGFLGEYEVSTGTRKAAFTLAAGGGPARVELALTQ